MMGEKIRYGRITVPQEGLKWIDQWQQWLQSKTGNEVSQGIAVAIACYWLKTVVDDIVKKLREEGYNQRAEIYESIARCVCSNTENLEDIIKGETEKLDQDVFEELMR